MGFDDAGPDNGFQPGACSVVGAILEAVHLSARSSAMGQ